MAAIVQKSKELEEKLEDEEDEVLQVSYKK
jgi:hypothetical protein